MMDGEWWLWLARGAGVGKFGLYPARDEEL